MRGTRLACRERSTRTSRLGLPRLRQRCMHTSDDTGSATESIEPDDALRKQGWPWQHASSQAGKSQCKTHLQKLQSQHTASQAPLLDDGHSTGHQGRRACGCSLLHSH